MVEEINHDRRRFLATAIMTIASAELGMIGSAAAQSSKAKPATVPAIKPGTNKSFGPLKQIDAGALERWICRSGSERWSSGDTSSWLALRHSQLRRCCPSAGVGGL